MATRSLFVGVNEYQHVGIRNLGGARRDAEALWALFSDTVPGIEAKLLVDGEATFASVSTAVDDLAASAGTEDTIVFFFSGHGTKDFRLVFHDTNRDTPAQQQETTLDMRVLARWFRETNAGAVLFILDCCHSGGAPAKVLEGDDIAAKAALDLDSEFVGKGRVLLAASAPHEVAWEAGKQRHGLLTASIMRVLTECDAALDVGEFCSRVTADVRSSAAAIGRQQSPHHINASSGGFLLPRLVKRSKYQELFPDLSTLEVHGFDDLSAYGFPTTLLGRWKDDYSGGLNALQLEAINRYRVLDGNGLLVVAPTGAGKTFAGELAALRAVLAGQRAVFALPYRALTAEKYEDFQKLYGSLGFRIIRCMGDYTDEATLFTRGKYDIALVTYEMFLGLALANEGTLEPVGTVVVDEAQFLASPDRGIAVELLLSLLHRRNDLGLQLVLLSAVIGDTNGMETWLGIEKQIRAERPVPLIEGVLDRGGVYEFRDLDGSRKTTQLLPVMLIQQRRDVASSQDVVVPLVSQLLQDPEETVLVFRNTRGRAEGCASYLANELSLESIPSETLGQIGVRGRSTASDRLHQCMERGTAFHTSNLQREERWAVESAFRERHVRALAATSGLAAGINTPASTVVIAEYEFQGKPPTPYTVAEYKNMAGRAGRPGFHAQGRSILLAESSFERAQLYSRYVAAEPESMSSSFADSEIETWLLRLLGQVREVPRGDVPGLLLGTYGGFLAARARPSWASAATTRAEGFLKRLEDLGLVEHVDSDRIALSLLGQACARATLDFESCLRTIEIMRAMTPTDETAEGLVVALQVLPEVGKRWVPIAARTAKDKSLPSALQQRVGHTLVASLQRRATNEEYLARCKRALLALDWSSGTDIEEMEREYSANAFNAVGYGDIVGVADDTRYHLRSVHEIGCLVRPSLAACPVDEMLVRLELGIPAECVAIAQTVRRTWQRPELLALRDAGVTSADEMWRLTDERLGEILGAAADGVIPLRPKA
jgi:helicase